MSDFSFYFHLFNKFLPFLSHQFFQFHLFLLIPWTILKRPSSPTQQSCAQRVHLPWDNRLTVCIYGLLPVAEHSKLWVYVRYYHHNGGTRHWLSYTYVMMQPADGISAWTSVTIAYSIKKDLFQRSKGTLSALIFSLWVRFAMEWDLSINDCPGILHTKCQKGPLCRSSFALAIAYGHWRHCCVVDKEEAIVYTNSLPEIPLGRLGHTKLPPADATTWEELTPYNLSGCSLWIS